MRVLSTTRCFGARLLSTSFLASGALVAASGAHARCVGSGGDVVCDSSAPNPDPNGVSGRDVTLQPGAIVQLQNYDPYAGASPGTGNSLIASRSLVTRAGSIVYDPTVGGIAVAALDGATVTHAGTITAQRSDPRAIVLRSGTTLAVLAGGVIETTGSGPSSDLGVGAAIGATAAPGSIAIDGAVRTSGSFAPAIRLSAVDPIGGSRTYYALNLSVGAGGSITTAGTGSVAVAMGSGSVTVAGTIATTGDGSSALTAASSGATLMVNAGGTISSARSSGVRLGGGTIATAAGSTISGTTAVLVDNLSGGAAPGPIAITNLGTIRGTGGIGLQIVGTSADRIDTSGLIAGSGGIAADLGGGDDLLIIRGGGTFEGVVDGGAGNDTAAFTRSASDTVSTDILRNFETVLVQAAGTGTSVTLGASAPITGTLSLVGSGTVVNRVTVNARLLTSIGSTLRGSLPERNDLLASFVNEGRLTGRVNATIDSFTNNGAIAIQSSGGSAVNVDSIGDFTFANSGTIDATGIDTAGTFLTPRFSRTTTLTNTGSVTGGVVLFVNLDAQVGATAAVTIANSGTISDSRRSSAALEADIMANDVDGTVVMTNGGTISSSGLSRSAAALFVDGGQRSIAYSLSNSGTITADGTTPGAVPATALGLSGRNTVAGTVTNLAGGTIAATGADATGLGVFGVALALDNAGTISGTGAAIRTGDGFANGVRNTGTITGAVLLGNGADRVENSGRIDGNVTLGDGADTFVQRAGAVLNGVADGGAGNDLVVIDATGGGAVTGASFVNFERLTQTGTGSVAYSGSFAVPTIELAGGTLTVAAGQTLSTQGPVTITGSDASETVVNNGRIAGAVQLGAGNDSFVEGVGSGAGGTIDGGAGIDTYGVVLAGNRLGVTARAGFEQLAVSGTGTLTLATDQSFADITLASVGLDLRLAGSEFTVDRVDGSDGAEQVAVDGDLPMVALGGGDDTLRLGAATAAGRYDGGSGADTLTFTSTSAATLSGSATGFESIALGGNALTVTGTLGAAADTIRFADTTQTLTIATGGRLAGTIDLGSGDDRLSLAAGASLDGTVTGGAGNDEATLALAADRALAASMLRDFEGLTVEGAAMLTLTGGAHRYDRVDVAGNIAIAADASLAAGALRFGGGDNRLTIAGGFAGAVDGGAGSDSIDITGGSAAAPIAFTTIANVEALRQSAGFATVSGNAALGSIALTGGRLVGLAGSTIAAPQISVGTGATFGSAGTVTGNIAVAGTLSPGASPGTMTVTGNVTLAATSVTLLEFTPTVSDKLLVSGTLGITSGATLTLTGNRPLTPGAALDLIVANGGISGSFTTINKPAAVFGFLRQSADRIQLLGTFDDAGFNPQVTAAIRYTNAVLTAGQASAALIAAVPSLLTSSGGANAAAFAQLTPEPYASAKQIAVEHGLTLAHATRSAAIAATGPEAGAFAFGQALGDWRDLGGRSSVGTARADVHDYGFIGGLGYGTAQASVGAFAGYLDSRQRIGALGARTDADGAVAGVTGQVATDGLEASALLAYDFGKARTVRALPAGGTARSRYRLRGWTADAALGYAIPLSADWALKPQVGATYVALRRGGAVETGGSPFALAVAGQHDHATFVDGSMALLGGRASGAKFHPWILGGVRRQLGGKASDATAGFIGATTTFTVAGVERKATLGMAAAGFSFDVLPGGSVFLGYHGEFGGNAGRQAVNGGFRLAF